MGKATLFIVAATVLAGATLLLNIQQTAGETQRARARHQEDLLARSLAESGRELALQRLKEEGSVATTPAFAYGGGQVAFEEVTNTAKEVAFTVEGRYEGERGTAVHRITSLYRRLGGFSSLSPLLSRVFPLNLAADEAAALTLAPSQNVYVDYDQLKAFEALIGELENEHGFDVKRDFSAEDRKDLLRTLLVGRLGVPPGRLVFASEQSSAGPLGAALGEAFDAQNPNTGERFGIDWFYEKALRAFDPDKYPEDGMGDARFEGVPNDSTGRREEVLPAGAARTFGKAGKPVTVHVEADALMESGSRLTGHGVLILEGNVTVEEGAALTWNGVVLTKGKPAEALNVDFQGDVTINGAFIGSQAALDPGGHLDVTVWRDLSGAWRQPFGKLTGDAASHMSGPDWSDMTKQLGCYIAPHCEAPSTVGNRYRPWWRHTHKYNVNGANTPGTQALVFFKNGSVDPAYEDYLRLNRVLAAFGPDEVFYLEFGPVSRSGALLNDGAARFDLRLDGGYEQEDAEAGGGFRGGASTFKSPPFKRDGLRDFAVRIGSVPRLSKVWNDDESDEPARTDGDGHRVTDGPAWVGNGLRKAAGGKRRMGAFTITLRSAVTDEALYEVAAYWHKKPDDEEPKDPDELQELAEKVDRGELGTTVTFGSGVHLNGDAPGPMSDLAERYGLQPLTTYQHVRTWVRHWGPGDRDAPAAL